MSSLVGVIIAICILIVAWLVVQRFSPDPLITKICQIIIFVIALVIVIEKILPLAGVHF
jgi:hypothetical protein